MILLEERGRSMREIGTRTRLDRIDRIDRRPSVRPMILFSVIFQKRNIYFREVGRRSIRSRVFFLQAIFCLFSVKTGLKMEKYI
jgi:hypothetical protein